MKEIRKFISKDGLEFDSADGCRAHEIDIAWDDSWVLYCDSDGNEIQPRHWWEAAWICLKGDAALSKLCAAFEGDFDADNVPDELCDIEENCRYYPDKVMCYYWVESDNRYEAIGTYFDLASVVAAMSHQNIYT